MPGYLIAEIDVHDRALFEEYRKLVPATIARYGGRYLVRGGATDTVEGDWAPKRIVVLEFPTLEQARKWYHSAEYRPILAMRLKAANSKAILVEGV
jgi:uncharacterized protein (DUF1330 family)